MRFRAATVGMLLGAVVLGGCGSSSEEPADEPTETEPTPSASPTAEPEPTPEAVSLAGVPAPEALSGFRCEKIASGWAAAGYVDNDGKESVDFQVTVYIGPADDVERQAVTKRLPKVAPGGSAEFKVEKLPAEGDECHVQVLKEQ